MMSKHRDKNKAKGTPKAKKAKAAALNLHKEPKAASKASKRAQADHKASDKKAPLTKGQPHPEPQGARSLSTEPLGVLSTDTGLLGMVPGASECLRSAFEKQLERYLLVQTRAKDRLGHKAGLKDNRSLETTASFERADEAQRKTPNNPPSPASLSAGRLFIPKPEYSFWTGDDDAGNNEESHPQLNEAHDASLAALPHETIKALAWRDMNLEAVAYALQSRLLIHQHKELAGKLLSPAPIFLMDVGPKETGLSSSLLEALGSCQAVDTLTPANRLPLSSGSTRFLYLKTHLDPKDKAEGQKVQKQKIIEAAATAARLSLPLVILGSGEKPLSLVDDLPFEVITLPYPSPDAWLISCLHGIVHRHCASSGALEVRANPDALKTLAKTLQSLDLRALETGSLVNVIVMTPDVSAVADRLLALYPDLKVKPARTTADSTPYLDDLPGGGAARDWALQLVADIKAYKRGEISWNEIDAGGLLFGPPGTGKTLLARSLAKTAGVSFFATSYGDWQSQKDGHLGNVTKAIRDIFAGAKKNAPSIIFIDEIDTIQSRDTDRKNADWWTSINNTLLAEIDGFAELEGVVVIGACNNPDRVDPALIRAGRLEVHVEVGRPEPSSLIEMLRWHLKGDIVEDADLSGLEPYFVGLTAADMAFIAKKVKRARRQLAGKESQGARPVITAAFIRDVIMEGQKPLPPLYRRHVAVHEAGHAVVASLLGREVAYVTLEGMGSCAGGKTVARRDFEAAQFISYLTDEITILLAGTEAEKLLLGVSSTGFATDSDKSDLALATEAALRLEMYFTSDDIAWQPLPTPKNHRRFDRLVSLHKVGIAARLEEGRKRARKFLAAHEGELISLAERLEVEGVVQGYRVPDASIAQIQMASAQG